MPERHFLGWDAPLLPRAASWIVERGARAHALDLAEWTVIVSGARTGRLLLGELVDVASERGLALVPPTIVTPGEAFEAVLGVAPTVAARPAGPLAKRLAWAHAVRNSPAPTVRALSRGDPEAHEDEGVLSAAGVHALALALATSLARIHADVSGHGVRFETIARHARTLGGDAECERWLAAAAIERDYARRLASWNLHDPALDRLERLERADASPAPIAGSGPVVLVGVPECPGALRRALIVSTRPVHALVHAPEREHTHFDELGFVNVERWAERALPVREEQLMFASSTTDAVDRALASITEASPAPSLRDVVIGLADETLSDIVRHRAGLYTTTPVRSAAGVDPARTPPIRLLTLVHNVLLRRSFADLMSLIRHPDVERWLLARADERRPTSWLVPLDEYGARQVPSRLAHLPEPVEPAERDALRFVLDGAAELLGDLSPGGLASRADLTERPLDETIHAVLAMLERVYGDRPLRTHEREAHHVAGACESIVACADEIISLTSPLGASAPSSVRLHAPAVLALLIAEASNRSIPELPSSDAIEMVGWLELAADPSPIAIVVGMTEGAVPSGREIDPILPGALRREAGLPGARDRLARDSFLLATIASSRPFARFVAPRRADDGSPMLPSRLLLRCERGALPARLARAMGQEGDGPASVTLQPLLSHAASSSFRTAIVTPAPRPHRMRVTSFRDYIASPYLFYLRHVLGVEERSAPDVEMDRLVFGSLVHHALEVFGSGADRDSQDERAIRDAVLDALRTNARARFGSAPSALIAVQIEHAAERLSAWAEVQAGRAADGWRIVATEWLAPRDPAPVIATSSGDMALSGKIDRVDAHPDLGWAILDYKTSDAGDSPERSHRRSDRWIDLQLPLYRTLVRPLAEELELSGEPALGYFNLPRNAADTAVHIASWSAEDLAVADEFAATIARDVIDARFDEVGRPNAGGTLGLLCGTGIMEIDASGDSDSEGAP